MFWEVCVQYTFALCVESRAPILRRDCGFNISHIHSRNRLGLVVKSGRALR